MATNSKVTRSVLYSFTIWIMFIQVNSQSEDRCLKSCTTEDAGLSWNCANMGCTVFPSQHIPDPSKVIKIDLSFNSLTSLPQTMNYSNLKHLDLSHNLIEAVDGEAFTECTQIETLNLSYNALTTITGDMLKVGNFQQLKFLNLSHNKITMIESFAFQFTQSLTEINLSNNKLKELKNDALFSNSLLNINLGSNEFVQIDATYFSDSQDLQYLSLRGNKINSIHKDSFQSMRNLETLDLGENELTSIHENIFHEGIHHPFSMLRAIHLDQNKITEIVENTFSPFPELSFIYLDDNNLKRISNNKAFPLKLKEISLKRNKALTKIQNGTFSGLHLLERIHLFGCYKLTEIEAGAFDQENSSLAHFDAGQCGLYHLPSNLFNWTTVSDVTLVGNPWECDCTLTWTKTTLSADVLSSMVCSTPHELKGYSLHNLSVEDMSCSVYAKYKHTVGIGLIVVVTVIFITAAAVLVYIYRKRVYLPKQQKKARGTYQSLFNTAEDGTDSTVAIMMEDAGPETQLLNNTEHPQAAVAV